MHVDVGMSSHPLLSAAKSLSSAVTSNSSGHDDALALGDADTADGLAEALVVAEPLSLTLPVPEGVPVVDSLLLHDGDAVPDWDTEPVADSDTLLVADAVLDAVRVLEGLGDGVTDGESDTVGVTVAVALGLVVGLLEADVEGEAVGEGLTHSPLVTEICTLSMPSASLLVSSSWQWGWCMGVWLRVCAGRGWRWGRGLKHSVREGSGHAQRDAAVVGFEVCKRQCKVHIPVHTGLRWSRSLRCAAFG